MKIAIAAPTYLPARRANTIQVMKMAQAMSELGHEVKVAVPSPSPQKIACRWDDLARHYGLFWRFEVNWLKTGAHWRGYDFSLKVIKWLKGWKAQLLYTRHPQTAALGSWLGIDTIFEVHDMPHGCMPALLFNIFLHGKGACRLVIITQALAEDLGRKFPSLASQLPLLPSFVVLGGEYVQQSTFVIIAADGVDLARYQDLPSPSSARYSLSSVYPQLNEERFTVGYTGHLYAGRGTDLLLAIAKAMPEVQFYSGRGEKASVAALQDRIQQEGIANILLTGFIPNADLPLFQAACDVLLMPYQGKVEASSGGDISRYLSPIESL
jgi:glycosyltransferase involved in cell wall biosynthesis